MFAYLKLADRLRRNIGLKHTLALNLGHEASKHFPAMTPRLRRIVLRLTGTAASVPIYVRLGTSDRDVLPQVFLYEEYAPITGLQNVRTIVDCGANIGLASVYLLERYPEATVLAIEPSPDNARICRMNLEAFGTRASVEQVGIWPTGSWNRPTNLLLDRNFGDRRDWAVTVRECLPHEKADVSGIALQSICDRVGQIDLLKMDIEGTEALLFSSNCETWLPRVRNLAVELHSAECRKMFERLFSESYRAELSSFRESMFARNIEACTAVA